MASPEPEDDLFGVGLLNSMATFFNSKIGESEERVNTPSPTQSTAIAEIDPAADDDDDALPHHFIRHLDNEEDVLKVKKWWREDLPKGGKLRVGSNEYFNWIAPVYGLTPEQMDKARFLKGLVEKHAEWIGLKDGHEEFRVLDYGAGTGSLSMVLAPYVTQILAIDSAQGMVDVYNENAAKLETWGCKMRAFRGDVATEIPYLTKSDSGIDGEFEFGEFDLVAICLTVDFFSRFVDPELFGVVMAGLILQLKDNSTLLVIDIERYTGVESNPACQTNNSHLTIDGLKLQGLGSLKIKAELEVVGMKDIEIKHGECLARYRQEDGELCKQMFFMLKATRPVGFELRCENHESGGGCYH